MKLLAGWNYNRLEESLSMQRFGQEESLPLALYARGWERGRGSREMALVVNRNRTSYV